MHAGAVIVPAVLAACERHNPDGRSRSRRHRGRRRGDVPAEPGRADAHSQGGLPPDRDLRRDGRGRGRRRRAQTHAEADRRCARRRRFDGGRHHRVSGRRHLDQAHARRLGGAVRDARGAAGARGLPRSAHRVRGHARPVPRLRQHHRGRLRGDRGRFRRPLADRDARVQALSVRDHDASLHRLRAAAGERGSRPRISAR